MIERLHFLSLSLVHHADGFMLIELINRSVKK